MYDNFATGRRDLLPDVETRLTVVEGDIVDQAHLVRVARSWHPDVVIHLAGIHYIPYCNAHRMETLRVNGEGTQSVLEACRVAGIQRVVAASSAAVYGISDRINCESDTPDPDDIYGISKVLTETLLRQYHREFGMACCAARLCNVYGPNETNPHVIPEILGQLARSDEIQLGNLDVYRDFVYVKDVARALMALARARHIGFGIFNVGTGQEYSIREVVQACSEAVGHELHVQSVSSRRRRVDRPHLRADCSLMTQVADWRAQYGLREGLAETIQTMAAVSSA